jgi:hypothetical protein
VTKGPGMGLVAGLEPDLRIDPEPRLLRECQPRLLRETTKEQGGQEDRHGNIQSATVIFLLQFSLFYVSSTFLSRFF